MFAGARKLPSTGEVLLSVARGSHPSLTEHHLLACVGGTFRSVSLVSHPALEAEASPHSQREARGS